MRGDGRQTEGGRRRRQVRVYDAGRLPWWQWRESACAGYLDVALGAEKRDMNSSELRFVPSPALDTSLQRPHIVISVIY